MILLEIIGGIVVAGLIALGVRAYITRNSRAATPSDQSGDAGGTPHTGQRNHE